MTYADAMQRFGSDKPGSTHHPRAGGRSVDVVTDVAFKVFSGPATSGAVAALRIPGGSSGENHWPAAKSMCLHRVRKTGGGRQGAGLHQGE